MKHRSEERSFILFTHVSAQPLDLRAWRGAQGYSRLRALETFNVQSQRTGRHDNAACTCVEPVLVIRTDEGLGHRVVAGISFARHADPDTVLEEQGKMIHRNPQTKRESDILYTGFDARIIHMPEIAVQLRELDSHFLLARLNVYHAAFSGFFRDAVHQH
jgi:hypothetical protein